MLLPLEWNFQKAHRIILSDVVHIYILLSKVLGFYEFVNDESFNGVVIFFYAKIINTLNT